MESESLIKRRHPWRSDVKSSLDTRPMTHREVLTWASNISLSCAREALVLLSSDSRRCAARAMAIIETRLREDRMELSRLRHMFAFEREARRSGVRVIAGIDEAGRGPLAGPVVAAAVILRPSCMIRGLNDSKQVRPEAREALFEEISRRALAIGVGTRDVLYIDKHNIAQAAFAAMREAAGSLGLVPDTVLVDGFRIPGLQLPQRAIVKGDALSCSIAAASIIAKVTRDRMMLDLDRKYPEYGFARHKGYTTHEHVLALLKHGPCPEHRRSFLSSFQNQLVFESLDAKAK